MTLKLGVYPACLYDGLALAAGNLHAAAKM
jgi:hypothetical protein